MSAKSTKGLSVQMTKAAAAPTVLAFTTATVAAPCVIGMTTTAPSVTGDLVTVDGSGNPNLDGKLFAVGAVVADVSIELLGSDNSDGTDVGGNANVYSEEDLVTICLSDLTMNVTEPGTVSTGTYCDPTTSIPSSVVEAGTLSLGGYVDITTDDYQELLLAESDGVERYLRVNLPDNGYLIAPMTISLITWDLPLDGAIGYTGTAVLSTKMMHVFETA